MEEWNDYSIILSAIFVLGLVVWYCVYTDPSLKRKRLRLKRGRQMQDMRGAYLKGLLADIVTDGLDDAADRGDISWAEARRMYQETAKVTGARDLYPKPIWRKLLKEDIKRRIYNLRLGVPIVFPDTPGWVVRNQHISNIGK